MGSSTGETIINAKGIELTYREKDGPVLKGIDLSFKRGELLLITGESGCGKTSLANVVRGMRRPTKGTVTIDDQDIYEMSDKERTRFRGTRLGLLFQHSGLLAGCSVGENILAPNDLIDHPTQIDEYWAGELCVRLGIAHLIKRPASGLSGGEAQRVALARAIVHKPEVLIADEPTNELDSHNTDRLHTLLRGLVDDLGMAVVINSHNPLAAAFADRIARMDDGIITEVHSAIRAE